MAITFDTLEYVNALKAADVPDKQAEAQAKAMRRVLDTALADHAVTLATKADIGLLKGDIGLLKGDIELLRKEIALARRDTIIWLGGMLIAGFGLVLRYVA